MKRLFLLLLLCASSAFAQDLRPSAYLGLPGKITVRGGKILGISGGVTTIAEQTLTPANSATTYVYIDLSGTPAVATSTSAFPTSSYFPICVVSKDANGTITTFTDSRPDSFMAGAGGVSANSPLPAATSGPGPVFNVKNYGAKGDTRSSFNCTGSGNNLNCTDLVFTAADVGKRVSCNQTAYANFIPVTTITAFINSTNVTLAAGANNSGICVIGTPDDTAISAALAAALAATSLSTTGGYLTAQTAAPTLYFPAGGYNLFNTVIDVNNGATPFSGFTLKGDGIDRTKIFWHSLSANAANAAMRCNNGSNFVLEDITFDGARGTSSLPRGIATSCSTYARHVRVMGFGGNGWDSSIQLYANDIQLVQDNGIGLYLTGPADIYESIVSNNITNMKIQNVSGIPFSPGVKWVGGLVDECGSAGACVSIVNSTSIWLIGAAIFTGMTVDGTSIVHLSGGEQGPFSSDANVSGLTIQSGGTVLSSDVRYIGTGTGKCINNSGIFQDNGNNSCESGFLIASGTSTGTTAVLTLTPVGANVNTNCSIGDALMVTQANIAGYNGYFPAPSITAVTSTTLTYTTPGSNLGALTAGGFAACRNLQTYTGNLPRAMLNNPIPNTCYLTITPIVNATTYNLCNFGAGSATNITRITASSQNVTTCATAPIITISNGTVSQTLTLTSGKQFWDSFNAQDASTGVGTTIFKPSISLTGTDRITVKYDAGALSACATPPTQLAISYNIAPILSN